MAVGKATSYADKFYGTVTESAANTLTFAEIMTNISVMEKWAWILHRLEWYMATSTFDNVISAGFQLDFGLTMSNKIATLSLGDSAVIDMASQEPLVKTDVGFERVIFPFIRDFTGLPGGGIIIAPRPLYVAAKGTGLAAACTLSVRGYFTPIQMSGEAYYDLLDAYRLIQ